MTTLPELITALSERAKGRIKGSARIEITDLGTLIIDDAGAREASDEADVVLSAKSSVFEKIMTGSLNPATAFMMGKLKVEGNPMRALKIGELLKSD